MFCCNRNFKAMMLLVSTRTKDGSMGGGGVPSLNLFRVGNFEENSFQLVNSLNPKNYAVLTYSKRVQNEYVDND